MGDLLTEKKIWQYCVAGTAVAMAILFYGVYVWMNAEAQMEWPVAEGKIVSSRVIRSRSYSRKRGITSSYRRSKVDYSYTAKGQRYQGYQYSSFSSLANNHRTGTTVSIYYDPADPSNSVLEPELVAGRSWTWIGFVLCIGFPITATVLSRQLSSTSVKQKSNSKQTGLGGLVQDPTNESEVLAWKQRNGMTV